MFIATAPKKVNVSQTTIAETFREEAASADLNRKCQLIDLVALAKFQCERLYANATGDDHYHAAGCWNSVGNMLSEAGAGDVERARVLEGRLIAADPHIPTREFFDIVLFDWEILSRFTYTWRALADIVGMTAGWPDDDRTRNDLAEVFVILDALDFLEEPEDE